MAAEDALGKKWHDPPRFRYAGDLPPALVSILTRVRNNRKKKAVALLR
jgi:hypothetical protein